MLLGHPLDHQDDEADRERIVAEHLGADRFGRADHPAFDREAADEGGVEALEQMDVLGFLAGEVEERPHPPVVVVVQRGARVIDQEREDELLHDPEDRQILMRADLVEDALLVAVERGEHAVRARLSGIMLREKSRSWSSRRTSSSIHCARSEFASVIL